MKLTHTLIACFAIVLGFTSCTKDYDPNPQAQQQTCKISKQYFYDNGVITDSLEYSYTGNNISKVVDRNDSSYFTLEYNSSNKVVKQNFFEPLNATKPYAYTTVTYNGDGSVAKADVYEPTGASNTLRATQVFTYQGGRLVFEAISTVDNGVTEKLEEHRYTWAGNNISKDVFTIYYSGLPEVDSISYKYDAKANYFKNGGTNQVFNGTLGSGLGLSTVALLLNANNLIEFSFQNEVYTLDYSLDAKANVTGIKVQGSPVFQFLYTCP